jgi:hypothetical protein
MHALDTDSDPGEIWIYGQLMTIWEETTNKTLGYCWTNISSITNSPPLRLILKMTIILHTVKHLYEVN